jgi:hypothetical protein
MSVHHGQGINISLGFGGTVFHLHYDWDSNILTNPISKTNAVSKETKQK